MQQFRKLKTLSKTLFQRLFSLLLAAGLLAYPFLVYFGLYHFEPRILYGILGGILLLRFVLRVPRLETRNFVKALSPLIAVGLVVALGILTNSELYMLFLPALITLSLAVVFGYSLYEGPSMIETFARMEVADLTPEDRDYCRDVTLVWVVFMLANSTLVVVLALATSRGVRLAGFDPLAVWTVYTGVVSYVLVGLLFAGEYLYRKWKFRRFQGSLIDRLLREFIPPRGNVTKTFVSLHKINVHGRRPDYTLATTGDRSWHWNDFNTAVSGLMGELKDRSGEKWLLTCRSGFAFSVGLIGIWQSGGTAVLPPSEQSETLSSLTEDADGVLTDEPNSFGNRETISPLGFEGPYERLTILDPSDSKLRLFTSGSSGTRKAIPKTLRHLQEEVRMQDEQWNHDAGGSRIVSTVSHQHIYGLLFKVLWPLSSGRVFESRSLVYPDDLIECIQPLNSAILVTTPTHLETFVNHEGFSDLAGNLKAIFSSGGPLSRETAERVHDRINRYPYEIFGSTETGGVAWRQQSKGEENPWRPFDRVRTKTSSDGTLKVTSPWVSVPESGWHDMRDRVEFRDDGSFMLKGRADRVENIAEKRVDLAELETRAEEHDSVSESAAIVMEDTSGDASRRRMKMAVVPTNQRNEGAAKELKEELRNHLLEYFEPVVLPRDIRLVEELPKNSEGKVPVEKLKALFNRVNSS